MALRAHDIARKVKSWHGFLILTLAGLSLVTSCGSEEQIAQLRDEQKAREHVLQQQIDQLNHEIDKLWRGVRCQNPRVAEFLNELKNCDSDTCATRNIDQMLSLMMTEQHVLLRLPASANPQQSIKSVAPIRMEQLRQRLGPGNVTHISRLLLMAMPLNVTAKTLQQDPNVNATVTGRLFKRYLSEELKLASDLPFIGPYPVTCKEKSQIMDRYARTNRDDKAVTEEPKPKDPQVALWIFKVDC